MQRLTIVRYKVKPEFVAENEQLSHAVFDRVRRDQPQGIDYSLFKEADGQSFSAFVLEQRLARARGMLKDARFCGRAISAIAFDSGFGDLSYFNRAFRRRYGATPSDVRAATRRSRDV